jgi:hypothetical protein
MTKEQYEAKKAARIERLKERAEKARDKAEQHKKYSDSLVEHIPFGQPILVGHYSEKSHRRTLERSRNHMFKMVEENRKAEHLEERAKAAENNRAISSDDPEAVILLKEKLEKLEAERENMKAVNAAWRKYAGKKNDDSALKALGFTDEGIKRLAAKIEQAYSWEKQPYPKWELSNLSQNIGNVKKRIEQLEKTENRETTEIEYGDIRMVENAEENRIQLFFPGKPDEETRHLLKSYGFRWSPYNECWQCYFNNRGIWNTAYVLKQINNQ